ncbi:septum site-determining protein MinC [Photobacterium kishitanii]|uniref:Probable septum site-determining protein MinC n=1 Tax=Photobacterium kishitanii TaxID=318456 RepID=A0A2T3KMP9_9GAMM|nr:septum site-determining protein MinC [Photobacterium kishitanii]PSV01058.1 septum site-determining protein MinC [Photobacterium kishitanii]
MSTNLTNLHFDSKIIPRVEVLTLNIDSIIKEYAAKKDTFPKVFSRMPLVLDISTLPSNLLELEPVIKDAVSQLVSGLRALEFIPIRIIGCSELIANECGLNAAEQVTAEDNVQINAKSTVSEHLPSTKYITGSVRGGVTIYDPDYDDLIILGDVKHGSEVAANGNVFILGKLAGRAHAGHKQQDSVIFAMNFDPEVAGINGLYLVNENIKVENINKPTLLKIEDDSSISVTSY